MRRRLRLMRSAAACLAVLAAGGCVGYDTDDTVQVDQSELVGAWISTECGQLLTLNDDKTATLRGFPIPGVAGASPVATPTWSPDPAPAPTGAESWTLDLPENHPFVKVRDGRHTWIYQVTRPNDDLRLVDDNNRKCVLVRKSA